MSDFKLHFANNNPNGLEVRDGPLPDFMKDYIDIKECTFCEFTSNDSLYKQIVGYISHNSKLCNSFKIKKKPNVSEATKLLRTFAKLAFSNENDSESKDNKEEKPKNDKTESEEDNEALDSTVTTLGLGIYALTYEKEPIIALHQSIGEPSGRSMNFHFSLVLIIPRARGQINILKRFVTHIIDDSHDNKDKNIFFNIYRWDADQMWWRHSGKKIARRIETIILPKSTKDRIMDDMEKFLSKKSIEWYFEHGIPYKRSYLFYGVPGSGKTSLIQGLAAKFNKNLCFLQPTSPTMTDDSFRECIQQCPENSIIVLEDIDALFDKDRKKKHEQCPLTFSGLLNGLDGVCNPEGQIFILTTNFVDQLDDALIRSGRVDVHIKFPLATEEQLSDMFKLFYPQSSENTVKKFILKMRECFPDGVSMATAQQHFITNMLASDEEAIEALNEIKSRIDTISKLNEQSKSKKEKEKEQKEKEEREKKENEGKKDKENETKEKDDTQTEDKKENHKEAKDTETTGKTEKTDKNEKSGSD